MILFACDLGGTRLKLGLVRADKLLAQRETDAEPALGLRGALPRLGEALAAMLAESGLSRKAVAGLALTFPGIIEPRTGRILSTPLGKFDDAPTLDLRREVERVLDLPVYVSNDANAALAGEWQFGAARGRGNIVMVTLGTGIGSSVIIEGIPLRGAHGQAGCLGGHLLANVHGRPCICGAVGCAETEASTWMLGELLEKLGQSKWSALAAEPTLDFAAVFHHAALRDPLAVALQDHCIRVWGASLVSLIHAYDPECVVLGGGIMRSADTILPKVCAYAARHAWTPWGQVEIVPAALGNHAGLFGVAWLAATHFQSR